MFGRVPITKKQTMTEERRRSEANTMEEVREVSGGIQVDDTRCDCNESTGKSKSEFRFAR